MQDNAQISLTVLAGTDGGLIIYEGDRLVFGGNLDEATTYLHRRMEDLGKAQPSMVDEEPVRKRSAIDDLYAAVRVARPPHPVATLTVENVDAT